MDKKEQTPIKPNKTVSIAFENLTKNKGVVLDLGCGTGRDTFFMARQGFTVIAIDNSNTALKEIKKQLSENNAYNIQLIEKNILKYHIENDVFDMICANNILNYLDKDLTLNMIKSIKKGITTGGLAAISVFTTDEKINNPKSQFKYFFENQELLYNLNDMEIVYYYEGLINNKCHFGYSKPHKHNLARAVARKK